VEILLFDGENLCRFEDETGLCFLLPARVFPLTALRIRLLATARENVVFHSYLSDVVD
jgi:hypothetical protein